MSQTPYNDPDNQPNPFPPPQRPPGYSNPTNPVAHPSQPHPAPNLVPYNQPGSGQQPVPWGGQPTELIPQQTAYPQPYQPSQPEIMPTMPNVVCFLEDLQGNLKPNPRPCNNPNYHVHPYQVIDPRQAGFDSFNGQHQTYRASVRETLFGVAIKNSIALAIIIALILNLENLRQLVLGISNLPRQIADFTRDLNVSIVAYALVAIMAWLGLKGILKIIGAAGTYVEIRRTDAAFLFHRPKNWMIWELGVETVQFGQLTTCKVARRNALFNIMVVRLNHRSITLTKDEGEKLYALASDILIQNQNRVRSIRTFGGKGGY